MKTREHYQKPTSTVINVKLEQSILAGSGVMGINGVGEDWYFDQTPGDGSDAY